MHRRMEDYEIYQVSMHEVSMHEVSMHSPRTEDDLRIVCGLCFR